MDDSFRRWDALAAVYDRIFEPTVLDHREAMAALRRALRLIAPRLPRGPLRVLDVGCGTGNASRAVVAALGEEHPLALTLVDGSGAMLERAVAALPGADVRTVHLPFDTPACMEAIGPEPFHLVVSAYAIHHLDDWDKRWLLGELAKRLRPDGFALNLDIVRLGALAASLTRAAEEAGHDAEWHAAVELGDAALADVPESDRNRDRPATLADQLCWWAEFGLEAAALWSGLDAALVVAHATSDVRTPRLARDDRVCRSVVETIGRTPLVALERLCAGVDGLVLLKLEYTNPGHSKKDRIALEMIEAARRSGQLEPGRPVVELTSGNTGTGLAVTCAVYGHPFTAVMSAGNSSERARMMAALGAEVVLVPQAPGSVHGQVSGADLERVEARAQQIVRERGAFRADQFRLTANVEAHECGTGPEILRQTGGRVDVFLDFVGSAGTFTGTARALKKVLPGVACYVVEPATAAFLSGSAVENAAHRIQGGGYCQELPLFERALCDGFLRVRDEEAIATARELARREGIFAGFSTGANVAAALRLLEGPHRGGQIVCLAADSGLKYLTTDLYA